MLVQRLKVLWLGFWSNLIGAGEGRHHSLVAQGAIEQHKQHLRNVREALTGLIFQKKKLGDQLMSLDREVLELKTDVQTAAAQNRDELAINLIARLETVQEEHGFLKTQIATIEKDVEMARATDTQLVKEIAQAEQMLGTLQSRHQALRVRKQLQMQLQSLSRSIPGTTAKLHQPLADQIHRLEAEMETVETKRESWEKEWQQMRENRSTSRHQQVLDQIKDGMRRQKMPVVIQASPVR